LRRCLSANVVTTAFKFGERVAFEFLQRFLARCHNPNLGRPSTVGCVGNHKKPENIACAAARPVRDLGSRPEGDTITALHTLAIEFGNVHK
jgi:hypothetical protein